MRNGGHSIKSLKLEQVPVLPAPDYQDAHSGQCLSLAASHSQGKPRGMLLEDRESRQRGSLR